MISDSDNDRDAAAEAVFTLERIAQIVRQKSFKEGFNPVQRQAIRFIARANRFSNSPSGLTQYLGATKGTVSQTLNALYRKKAISKVKRAGENRSWSIELTEIGRKALQEDPLQDLVNSFGQMGGKTRRRLAKGLRELHAREAEVAGLPSFGVCGSCRFFKPDTVAGGPAPHFCKLYDQPLSDEDAQRICIAHALPSS